MDAPQALEAFARLGYPQSEAIEAIQPAKKGQSGYRNVLSAIKSIKRDNANRKVFTALVYGDEQSKTGLSRLAGDVVSLGQGGYFVVSMLPLKRCN